MNQQDATCNQQNKYRNPSINGFAYKMDQYFIIQSVFTDVKRQNFMMMYANKKLEERSQKDCRLIADFLKNQKYFQRISKNMKMLLQISSWIEFKKYNAGQYIYKINQYAECFFIVLKGQVHLTYPQLQQVINVTKVQDRQLDNFNFSIDQKDQNISVSSLSFLKQTSTPNHSKIEQKSIMKKKKLQKQTSLNDHMLTFISVNDIKPTQTPKKPVIKLEQIIINVIIAGQCFGDLEKIIRRGTNAITKQQTYLLIIKKQHYDIIYKAQLKSQNKVKFQFLSSLQLFRMVSRYTIESLLYLLEEVKVSYNNSIYKQDQPLKYIYIVYKGEFKYYKKIKSNKEKINNDSFLQIKEKRNVYRSISFKTLEIGEIFGHLEAYQQDASYRQTCVCKSQEGIVLKFDRTKFFKKIFVSDNNCPQLKTYFQSKYEKKQKNLTQFINKHQNNTVFIRYLHTPCSAFRKRCKTQIIEEMNTTSVYMKRMSVSNNNFFDKLNKTIYRQENNNRISIKTTMKMPSPQRFVPRGIRDIVQIVNQESNYHKIRKPKHNTPLFDFNIDKVPLHVKKKYQILFKRNKKKQPLH